MAAALAARAEQVPADHTRLTPAEASAAIRSRALTPVQLVQACLARIEVYNPKLNAFITVLRDQALSQAAELEREQRAGKLRSPLHGIPIARDPRPRSLRICASARSERIRAGRFAPRPHSAES